MADNPNTPGTFHPPFTGTGYGSPMSNSGRDIGSHNIRMNEFQAPPEPRYPYKMMPFTSPKFTGRASFLNKLRRYFTTPAGQPHRRKHFLLYGMGGAGKTQICLKFAEETQDLFHHVFWIDATSAQTIKQSLKDLIHDPAARSCGVRETVESVMQWISTRENEWIIIFDNAADPTVLSSFMPAGTRGNVLITSRNPNLREFVDPQGWAEVAEMEEEEAISFLLKTAYFDEVTTELKLASRPIVIAVHCVPLVVDQAGASIANGLCDMQDYLQKLHQHRLDMLGNPSFQGTSNYGHSVYGTWDVSFAEMQARASKGSDDLDVKAAAGAMVILQLVAFLHHENISEDMFRRAAETVYRRLKSAPVRSIFHKAQKPILGEAIFQSNVFHINKDGHWDGSYFAAAIQMLQSFSLIKWNEGGKSYTVHPLIQFWCQDSLTEANKQGLYHSAKMLLCHSITFGNAATDCAFHRSLLHHIVAIQQNVSDIKVVEYIDGDEKLAIVFKECGFMKEAEKLEVRVMEHRQKALGTDHLDTVRIKANLAHTYLCQGKFAEAERLGLLTVKSMQKAYGPEHSETLTSIGKLAGIYASQSKYHEAEELSSKTVEQMKRVMGPDHPVTLKNFANLANCYHGQGKYNEAEELGFKTKGEMERVLGLEHPDTLKAIATLAIIYQKQGKHNEAEKCGLHLMETVKRVLGPDHLLTLACISNLAIVYESQGKHDEAEQLQSGVMEAKMRVFGANNSLADAVLS